MVRPITTVSNASALASTATAATTTAVTGASDRVQALWASGEKLDAQDPAVVHETAARLVSELFFAPMLAEMREFPFGKGIADYLERLSLADLKQGEGALPEFNLPAMVHGKAS